MLPYLGAFTGGFMFGAVAGLLADSSSKEENGAILFNAFATSALASGLYCGCATSREEILTLELAAFSGFIAGFASTQAPRENVQNYKQQRPCNTF